MPRIALQLFLVALSLGSAGSARAQYLGATTFDYIVVGGGPSGLITSQRLTETGKSVLLIERGGASTASTGGRKFVPWSKKLTYYDVPGVFESLPTGTGGEAYCADTPAVAGCVLGGGGSVNGMAFIHPPTQDFDDGWPSGWNWDDIEPAAERLYKRNPGTTMPSRDGRAYDNGAAVVLTPWLEDNDWSFVDGIKDPNSKEKSFGPTQLNIANGLRSGPIHTYLPLAQKESGFTLRLNAKVIRVVRKGGTMTGVEIEDAEGTQIVKLKPDGAVLLAAGVMSTPRVLFNSGIGPIEQIKIVNGSATGVDVPETDWINLPVGRNVKDHSRYQLEFKVPGGLNDKSPEELLNPTEEEKRQFADGSGVLTQSFQRLDLFRQHTTSNDRVISFHAHCSSNADDTLQIMLMITHGLTSTGTLGIDSNGNTVFTKRPWTNTDTDREAWSLAINEILEMSRQPGSPIVYSGDSDATAESVLSADALPGIHIVGSAKMGTDDGRTGGTAVVDLNTKVYGTNNLYVVDASFHPDLSTGNNQAMVMIAAEHAVQKIISSRKR
ncbi:uncharacterized protein L3040_009038 [Drepanopeziza brunnea f. sp. 'multigermtubi']|uniref:GMC oxidoreductase n=1 Tax=Marssonina brunnea f. sp. multigermtubi (strain MB_m1) TaxID=1072389 RepID=K1W4J8_MARBU|nr:GMC oxidoreductase [Drepanopeziza brunnea f. sp. 'multigermtubi' MB_m1]EKD11880.1 GMC oxidoreductase [Drepanopeziza brunnea f. sp. 'multigermtubi' MB_m1]KAJ5032433.1 hypothetical protein L3040_009038 [Drepanopeziza brunnea f. sp. 'multigermtubi']